MRRLTIALAVAVFTVAACGDDNGGTAEVNQAVRGAGDDFCQLVQNMQELEDRFDAEAEDGEEDEGFTDEQRADLANIVAAYVDAAPDEIREQVEIQGRQIEQFLKVVEITDGDIFIDPENLTEEQQQEIAEIEEEYADIAGADVEDEVNAFIETECGIDMDDDGDTAGDGSTSDAGGGTDSGTEEETPVEE